MDMSSCEDCLLFKEKFKNPQLTKTKTGELLVILNNLPKNPDGSVNYEDLEFAVNARNVMMGKNICDKCDKTKCLCTSDPVEAKAKVKHCRKEWDRMDVNEYLRQNGWTKHDIAWFWDEDLTEDYREKEDREEYYD